MSVRLNVLASWASHLVMTGIGFFLMPYVIHTIGDQSYGTWVFLNAIAGYTGLLYFGFGETISKYVSQHAARREWGHLNEIVSGIFAAYFVSGGIAMLGAVLLAIAGPWIFTDSGQSLREIQCVILILGANAALSIMGSVNGGVLYGIQRFDLERGILVTGMVTKLGLTLLLLSGQYPLVTLALVTFAHTALEQACYFIAARWQVPTLKIRWRNVRWSVVKESYGFAALSGIGLVAAKLIYDTDYIVIGFALGNPAIVPFAIGSRLSEMVRKPILQIGEVFLPRASELKANSDANRLQSLVCTGMGVAFLLSAGLFVGGWYFGETLIELWMGTGYSDSHLIFLILIGAQILASPAGILHMVLVGIGDVRIPSLLRMAQAILNLLLSLMLVKPLGIIGVALGTLLPVVVMDLAVLIPYGARRIQMTPGDLVKRAFAPCLVPIAALALYSQGVARLAIAPTWPGLVAVTAGGGAVLLMTWLGVGHATQRFLKSSEPAVGAPVRALIETAELQDELVDAI